MLRYSKYIGFGVSMLMLLAGCGVTTMTTTTSGGSLPTATTGAIAATLTPAATSASTNPTPGTTTNGPLVLTTDHATYATNASIQVTLTNGLTVAIGAYDHQASCSIFGLETQVNGAWQDVAKVQASLASCSQGTATTLVTVSPNSSYHATIQAGTGIKGGVFPPGQYRLRLLYTTTPAASDAVASVGNPAFTSLYSAVLTLA